MSDPLCVWCSVSCSLVCLSPIISICASQVLLHRFYFRAPMSGHFKLLRVCMTSLFVGCKMEETPVGIRDVCAVFDRLLKRRAGVDCTPLSESRLAAWRESIRSMEGILLRECGFEVSCETPHAFILHFLAYMRPRPRADTAAAEMDASTALEDQRWSELQQRSWSALNDCLLSPKILFSFRAEVVACAAIVLAASLLSQALPAEWWMLFDVKTQELDQCSLEFATLYARLSRYGTDDSSGGSSMLQQLDYTPTDANDNETNNELMVYRPRNRRALIEEQRRKKIEEAAAAAAAAAGSGGAAPAAAASAATTNGRTSAPPTDESSNSGSAPMQM